MISYSVSSFLTGHIDVIHTSNFRCRVETNRAVLFSKLRRTLIYDVTVSDWDSISRPVAVLHHSSGLDAKSSLACHKNIVDHLEGLGDERKDITLAEAFEVVSTSFWDYGAWQWLEKKS